MAIKPITGVSVQCPVAHHQGFLGCELEAEGERADPCKQMLRRGLILDLSIAFGELI